MAESKVKRENFIAIQGWMVTDLKLKGNELILYACIYGFSQAEEQKFSGSLQYLADWTNCTKQGVINCLKSLLEKGLIIKTDKLINGVKFCEYHAKNLDGVYKKVEYPIQESCMGGIQKSLPNNIDINNLLIINNIIDYLNNCAGKKFKASSKSTQKHIKARLAEGFTEDDFKTVIQKKVKEWKGTNMDTYLRPETLFGTKFEGYLNSNVASKKSYGANGVEIAPDDGYDWGGVF